MHYDIIIIGMGLAGLMAAKTAIEAGQRVLIIGKGMGSLCLFSSTIDVLGTLTAPMKMKNGLSQWIQHHPRHPYSNMGVEKIVEALSSFTALFPSSYSFRSINDGNCLMLTGAGTLRPTYLIPTTMLAGNMLEGRQGLVVGFKGYKDFYAHYVAAPLKCQGMTLSLPESPREEMTAAAVSRLMEKQPFRERIGKQIRERKNGATWVGFPAILGLHDPIHVKKDLEDAIGAEIFEISTLPPSIPGQRIFARFKEYLIQKGATWLLGHSISQASLNGKRCEMVFVSNPPVLTSYSADRFVLATGRFVGGGLAATQEKIFEPIFNLPVCQPASREHWFGKTFFANHPIHQVGIQTDPCFRPIDDKGDVLLENVWLAGSILAHHDSIGEKSREGIEIATGYMAAKRALEK